MSNLWVLVMQLLLSAKHSSRNCVHVCKKLGFTPILSDGSKPDFSLSIPNIAFKLIILNWCDNSSIERPESWSMPP
uniref:Secreted protein n=1 Tax=Nelumbo nucifera TaxID=4432 RepID=A0A822YBW5_NELNU|nr:TPA_asm: hypothetical protein HUJ06_030469 [Nelumbo nucifera]